MAGEIDDALRSVGAAGAAVEAGRSTPEVARVLLAASSVTKKLEDWILGEVRRVPLPDGGTRFVAVPDGERRGTGPGRELYKSRQAFKRTLEKLKYEDPDLYRKIVASDLTDSDWAVGDALGGGAYEILLQHWAEWIEGGDLCGPMHESFEGRAVERAFLREGLRQLGEDLASRRIRSRLAGLVIAFVVEVFRIRPRPGPQELMRLSVAGEHEAPLQSTPELEEEARIELTRDSHGQPPTNKEIEEYVEGILPSEEMNRRASWKKDGHAENFEDVDRLFVIARVNLETAARTDSNLREILKDIGRCWPSRISEAAVAEEFTRRGQT